MARKKFKSFSSSTINSNNLEFEVKFSDNINNLYINEKNNIIDNLSNILFIVFIIL